jgi:SAM-dependent methyltransferase
VLQPSNIPTGLVLITRSSVTPHSAARSQPMYCHSRMRCPSRPSSRASAAVTRLPWRICIRASESWIWAPAAASTLLLSARRVGERGFAYGVEMTDEMLELARANQARAGLINVEFLKGTIENIPLPDASIDVVISNCVINLSIDKSAVIAEMFRVLTPGGRIGISDVVAEDHLTLADRAERGSYVGCIAGARSKSEYLEGLAAAGFLDVEVRFTHQAASGMHSAIVRAVKPAA